MDRCPALLYVGAAILGKVGAEMIVSDPFIVHAFSPRDLLRFWAQAAGAVAVPAAGLVLRARPGHVLTASNAVIEFEDEGSGK